MPRFIYDVLIMVAVARIPLNAAMSLDTKGQTSLRAPSLLRSLSRPDWHLQESDLEAFGAVALQTAEEIKNVTEFAEVKVKRAAEVAKSEVQEALSGSGFIERLGGRLGAVVDVANRVAFPEHHQPNFFREFPVRSDLNSVIDKLAPVLKSLKARDDGLASLFQDRPLHKLGRLTNPIDKFVQQLQKVFEARSQPKNGTKVNQAHSQPKNGAVAGGAAPTHGERGPKDQKPDREETAGAQPQSPMVTFEQEMQSRTSKYYGTVALFAASLVAWCAFGLLIFRSCGKGTVTSDPQASEEDLSGPRGKWGWGPALLIETGVLAYLCFRVSLLLCIRYNIMVEMQGPLLQMMGMGAPNPIQHPGWNASIAGQGLVFSIVWALICVFYFRWAWNVRITDGLVSHFMLRGAFMSTILAIGFEMVGFAFIKAVFAYLVPQMSEGAPEAGQPQTISITFAMMMFVGLAEELAKAIPLLAGVWFCRTSMLQSAGATKSCWASLLDSPRALMLAGFAIGSGFMVTENAKYLIQVSVVQARPGQQLSGQGLETFRVMIVCVRIFGNLHPWLTGLTAGRVAQIVFAETPALQRPYLSLYEFMSCLALAATIHGLYDFCVSTMNELALLIIIGFVGFSMWMFKDIWTSFEEEPMSPKIKDSNQTTFDHNENTDVTA